LKNKKNHHKTHKSIFHKTHKSIFTGVKSKKPVYFNPMDFQSIGVGFTTLVGTTISRFVFGSGEEGIVLAQNDQLLSKREN
jgi:hypothetical protein